MKHFCCDACRKAQAQCDHCEAWSRHDNNDQCDLCEAQERNIREKKLLAEGKPTLTHKPFAALLQVVR